jgi:hypothetical protein
MKPKMKGERGTPMVTSRVQMPMYLARSFLRNVSVTTALPMAAGGLIKKCNDGSAYRHRVIVWALRAADIAYQAADESE